MKARTSAFTPTAEEHAYLNGPESFWGLPKEVEEPLREKFMQERLEWSRRDPWFSHEFSHIQFCLKKLKIPNRDAHRFHVYWLAQRFGCSEEDVLRAIVGCHDKYGPEYTAGVFRFGSGHRFTWLRNGPRIPTGRAYSQGLGQNIPRPSNWGIGPGKEKAGSFRFSKLMPDTWEGARKKWKLEIEPFARYMMDLVSKNSADSYLLAEKLDEHLRSEELESLAARKLWGRIVGLVTEDSLVQVATDLVPSEGKRRICEGLREILAAKSASS